LPKGTSEMSQAPGIDHWNKVARTYQETAHGFTSQYARAALDCVSISADDYVLDVAAGTGALAFIAAQSGARVLATDFSPAMVACIAEANVANIEARVMDGQALDLPDNTFDAVFSIFGVMMFQDWRKGLCEMHRVTKPNGVAVITTWKSEGAATFLLLSQIRQKLFPNRVNAKMPDAIHAWSDPTCFSDALKAAGFRDTNIHAVTKDFELPVVGLEEPDKLFGMSEDWISLTQAERTEVVCEAQSMADGQPILRIPSTALIGVAIR
jgi:ubiquinone/menaquinone biosynthesis C-methylase UbiE